MPSAERVFSRLGAARRRLSYQLADRTCGAQTPRSAL